MTLSDHLPRTAAAIGLVCLFLALVAGYALFMHSINLPEEWPLYCLGGAAIGLLVGRWPAVAGALVALSIPLTDPDPGSEAGLLWELTFFVYIPMAALGIAAGVAVHRGARRLVRRGGGRSRATLPPA